MAGNGMACITDADQPVSGFQNMQVHASSLSTPSCVVSAATSGTLLINQEHRWGLTSEWLLQALVLDDNSFSSWQRLRPLAWLPSLQRLSLSGNSLSSIHQDKNEIGAPF